MGAAINSPLLPSETLPPPPEAGPKGTGKSVLKSAPADPGGGLTRALPIFAASSSGSLKELTGFCCAGWDCGSSANNVIGANAMADEANMMITNRNNKPVRCLGICLTQACSCSRTRAESSRDGNVTFIQTCFVPTFLMTWKEIPLNCVVPSSISWVPIRTSKVAG